MSKSIVSVGPSSTVGEALAVMRKHAIHELPVMDGKALRGWVSYERILARGKLSNDAKVAGIMLSPPRMGPDTGLIEAAAWMVENHARALPIVDEASTVVGILSRTDVARAAGDLAEVASQPLAKVMTRDLETAREDELIDPVEHRLKALHVNQVLVLDEHGKLQGYLDLERVTQSRHQEDGRGHASGANDGKHSGEQGQLTARSVQVGSLSRPAPTIASDGTLGQAIQQMSSAGTTFVAVVEDGYPVGIVSRADVLLRMAAQTQPEGVLVQLSGLGDRVDGGVYDQIYSRAQAALKKMSTELRLEYLALHFKERRPSSGGDTMFVVTAHLSTEREFLVTKSEAWDPVRATDDALDVMEGRVRDHKERRLERRKGGPRRGAAFYQSA